MDMNEEIRKSILASQRIAIEQFAEMRGIPTDEVNARMGDYDPESNTIEWLCWQKGTWVYQADDGTTMRL